MTRKKKLAIASSLLFVLLAYIVNSLPALSAEGIKTWIESLGPWAPVVYIVIYALRPLVFFPASVLTLTGGVLFGAWFGTLYTLIGATLSAVVGYVMAERLSKLWSSSAPNDRLQKAKRQMEENGFIYVVWFRLVPFLNFDVVSYVAGLARVKWLPFILATVIGMFPGTVAYNFLGGSLIAGDWRVIVAALTVVVLFTVISLIVRKKLQQKEQMGE
ncbi:putative membrane protein YdjX (TVP38/TMEM64 family) [Chryseomicrobium aureum]|uniref:TVP38/TMEM64 family protein n=1 Tax=Chryseomicrobium aureum TaxID=1441723 RepID=UPI00195ABEC4|nr:TVP38/TMEM64 family protein [Chryseomicrobium aureum]MBM7707581.1 putative membrane protein YdjX (TVP38/TMEM64 family) [Chryseomicrobium aureum]